MGWSDDLRIGIKSIDDQHQSLFDCFSRLKAARLDPERQTTLLVTIIELSDYANIHFFMEEGIMRASKYPLLEEHLVEHQAFSAAIDQLREKSADDGAFDEAISLLEDWLSRHIGGSDQKFSEHYRRLPAHSTS